MRRHSGYLIASGAVFAVASFLIGLEVSATPSASGLEQAAPSVNRTLKADRLQRQPGTSRNAINAPIEKPAPKMELLDGCEPMISSIGQSPLARIPGRCVS
ncbi:MAG: hypothetical protein IT537_23945 [Hyphomicrobiales bacterium]|nr:hypothetical protein [Hyphomicrobiales bacterium]